MASQLLSRTQPALAVAVLAALLIGLASALADGEATSDTRLSQQRDSREARSDEQQAEDWAYLPRTGHVTGSCNKARWASTHPTWTR